MAACWLWLGPPGSDLAAHEYLRWFFREHGFALWDNSWYSGRYVFVTYSVLTYPLAAVLGVKVLFAAAAGLAGGAFARLTNHAPAVWAFAVVWGCFALSGALPFALGVAFALVALNTRRLFPLFAALTWAASPLALLLLLVVVAGGVRGGALLQRRDRAGRGTAARRVRRLARPDRRLVRVSVRARRERGAPALHGLAAGAARPAGAPGAARDPARRDRRGLQPFAPLLEPPQGAGRAGGERRVLGAGDLVSARPCRSELPCQRARHRGPLGGGLPPASGVPDHARLVPAGRLPAERAAVPPARARCLRPLAPRAGRALRARPPRPARLQLEVRARRGAHASVRCPFRQRRDLRAARRHADRARRARPAPDARLDHAPKSKWLRAPSSSARDPRRQRRLAQDDAHRHVHVDLSLGELHHRAAAAAANGLRRREDAAAGEELDSGRRADLAAVHEVMAACLERGALR